MPIFLARMLVLLAFLFPGINVFLGSAKVGMALFIFLLILLSPYILHHITQKRKEESVNTHRGFSYFFGVSYIFLQYIAIFRGSISSYQDVSIASMAIFIIVAIPMVAVLLASFFFKNKNSSSLLDWSMYSLAVLLILNIVLWALGYQNDGAQGNLATNDQGSILTYFGIYTQRVFFPLSLGVNSYGSVCGVLLIYGLVCLRSDLILKSNLQDFLKYGAFIFVPLASIMLTDSRGALISALLAFVFIFFNFKKRFFIIVMTMLFGSIGVLNYYIVFEFTNDIIAFLARESSQTSVLSGRELIWEPIVEKISIVNLESLLGYGLYGHATSDLSKYYIDNFQGWDSAYLAGAHNLFLQIVLDAGYIGYFSLFFFIFFIFFNLNKFQDSKKQVDILNSILFYMILMGFSESSISPYVVNNFLIIFVIVLTVRTIKNNQLKI